MEKRHRKIAPGFRTGKMNRRQLVQSLSLAAAAASVPTTVLGAAAPQPTGKLQAGYVNHISYSCQDYRKVRDFYVDLLGMKVTQDDGMQCRLVFGNNILIPRNRAKGEPAKVDHIAYTVINWDTEKDAFEAQLKRRGLMYTGSAKTQLPGQGSGRHGRPVRRLAPIIAAARVSVLVVADRERGD
jgi:catechol 2,3-dioxygenase-like lactoylglutathione lyase family enzyme